MLDTVVMRSVQSYEFIKMNGWPSFFRETVYRNRPAVIFEKDLRETKDQTETLNRNGTEMIEINKSILAKKKYDYRFKNRYLKAVHYLGKKYAGFGLVKRKEIIGEMWYCTAAGNSGDSRHEDLDLLGITLSENHVYAFDWFLVPQERGGNIAGSFQANALNVLSRKGYDKAYSYVWLDNTPALWSTRFINKWKEVRTERMTRFLVAKRH